MAFRKFGDADVNKKTLNQMEGLLEHVGVDWNSTLPKSYLFGRCAVTQNYWVNKETGEEEQTVAVLDSLDFTIGFERTHTQKVRWVLDDCVPSFEDFGEDYIMSKL